MILDHKTHALHVYENEHNLLESILEFWRKALPQGGTAIAIAKRSTAKALREHFENSVRVPEVRLITFDADEMLNRFMFAGQPDEARFRASVGKSLEENSGSGPVAAYGEMVAVLWERGEADAAIELERIWNRFLAERGVPLLCAYSAASLTQPTLRARVPVMYGEHSVLDVPRGLARIAPTVG